MIPGWRWWARGAAALFFVGAGVSHFTDPGPFIAIVPAFLPAPRLLVHVSGVFEILGGLGLLVRPVRRAAATGLVLLLIAVFPANVNMAVNRIPFGDVSWPTWALWLRLPLQLVLIAWVLACRDPVGDRPSETSPRT